MSIAKRAITEKNYTLPDLLRNELDLVICGTAVSNESSRINSYYAGHGNKFWSILKETGLTPIKLKPQNYEGLTEFGIGITDLAKNVCGADKDLKNEDYNLSKFREKILKYQPYLVGFNGKKAAKIFLCKYKVEFGRQDVQIGATILYVLPSTSNSANRWWNSIYWFEIANLVNVRKIEYSN